jgi:drug/metabolite transporter (DMT)-like permease
VLWGRSITDVGAGIATVAVNIQVLIVPMLALVFTGERPSRRFWITMPVIICGVALAGGVIDTRAFGENPLRGVLFAAAAGVAYGIYLFQLRRGGQGGQRFVPVCAATAGAAAGSLVLGGVDGGIDFTPGWPALGWLIALALSGQVIGWLLIGVALPRLNSGVGATLLLVQPIGAVTFGILLLHEQLGVRQTVGCALVVAVVWFNAAGSVKRDGSHPKRRSASAAEGNPAGAPAGHQPVASSR